MSVFIGTILGMILRAALIGAVLAWVLRRGAGLRLMPSYVVGVIVAATTGVAVDVLGFGKPAGEILLATLIGAPIGFTILWATARRRGTDVAGPRPTD